MMLRLLIWGFILFMVVRFILRFVLPVVRITRTAQDRLRQMQQQMEDMNQKNHPPQQKKSVQEGDYIEYEEVK